MSRTSRLHQARLQIESLEGRALPAQVEWINPAGGDWAVPDNWSTGKLPGADDDVIIDLPADFSVIHSQGTSTIRSLTNRETLMLVGGTLSVLANSTSDGDLQLAGGTLTGTETLTVNGRLVWTDGAMNGTSVSARTVANGVLLIVGAAQKTLGRMLENNGWAYVTGGDIRMNMAGFSNEPDGTLELDGVHFATQTISSFGSSGLMRARNGVGIRLPYVGLGGTVDVFATGLGMGAGTGGRVSWGGTIRLFQGAGIGASTDIFQSDATITGEGSVAVNGDRVSLGGDVVQITGNVSLAGMSGNVNSRTFAIGGGLTINATYGGISSPSFQSASVGISSSSGASITGVQITTGAFSVLGGGRSEILNSAINAESFANTSLIVADSHITAGVITSGGVLTVRGSTTFTVWDRFENRGDLVGAVQIEGDLINSGWIRPSGNESRQVVITGNFTQTATGEISLGLGGTEPGTGYDQIQIGGTATLDGRLTVLLQNGFLPQEGDSFEVLTFAEHVGEFATISVPQFDDDVFLDPTYGAASLALLAVRR